MSSQTTDFIDDLAKESRGLFEKLEQRRAAAAKLQKNFLLGLKGDIEIEYETLVDAAADVVAGGDSVPQEPRTEGDEQGSIANVQQENKRLLDAAAEVKAQETLTMEHNQSIIVRIQPDNPEYEVVIREGGAGLEIRGLPASAFDKSVSKLEIGMALTNILAYGLAPARFSAGHADVPGAARRLRSIVFSGLGKSDGQCPGIIDAFYKDGPEEKPSKDILQVPPDSAFYEALVGSDLGSIVPNFLLANVAAISVPEIGKICVKREIRPGTIATKAVLDLTSRLETTLATFVLDVEKELEGENISLEKFHEIIDKSRSTNISAFNTVRAMDKMREEETEYVYSMSFELPG